MNFYIKCYILLSAPDASWHKSYNIKEGGTNNYRNACMGYNLLGSFGIYVYRCQPPETILEVHTSKQFQFYFPSPWMVLMLLLGVFIFF